MIIVDVLQSKIAPHQLKINTDNFAYFYRDGSRTKQMEHWQIQDVGNRQSGPDLRLLCILSSPLDERERQDFSETYKEKLIFLKMPVYNENTHPVEYFTLILYVDDRLNFISWRNDQFIFAEIDSDQSDILDNGQHSRKYTIRVKPHSPIFDETLFHWVKNPHKTENLKFSILNSEDCESAIENYCIKWVLRCPNGTSEIIYL